MDELIRLESITKVYGSGESAVVALSEFSLTVAAGELLAVMGPSGSGKSTLMNILGCLDTPTSGRYWFGGERVSTLHETRLARAQPQDRICLPAVPTPAQALSVAERRAPSSLQECAGPACPRCTCSRPGGPAQSHRPPPDPALRRPAAEGCDRPSP